MQILAMSVDGGSAPPPLTTVAVAVKGGRGGDGGRGSRRAVRWAAENLMPKADRIVLIHVMPAITTIPTPSGDSIPIEELDANVVRMFVHDMKLKFEEIFIPFKKLCKTRKIETLVLEGDNPASSLLKYITDLGIRSLVLGSCSSYCFTRKLKNSSVPSVVLKHAPETCEVYVVSRRRLITTCSNHLSTSENNSRHCLFTQRERGSLKIIKLKPDLYSLSTETFGASSVSDLSQLNSKAIVRQSSPGHSSALPEKNRQMLENNNLEIQTVKGSPSVASIDTKQSDVQAEVEQLRLELESTVSMYNRACEDLVHAQNKVRLLSTECLEEARQVNAALKREEVYRKIAAEEKEKHSEAVKEVEMARNLLAKEAYERQIAELKALKESLEKQKIADALFTNDRRYKRYTRDEIEIATDFFSDTKMIGEGAYGKVYRCSLDNTPVAVKILQPGASDKKQEFLREVSSLAILVAFSHSSSHACLRLFFVY
ncbi:hypothetical protein CsSME_00050800 [Camellia sinensis var. sinensis]